MLRNDLQVGNISKTDSSQGIFVSNISKRLFVATNTSATTAASTTNIRSELYYNGDGKRRLFVDLWQEKTPTSAGSPTSFHLYFTSRQELKKTFGGWRTNETDYHFNSLDYSHTYNKIPITNPLIFNYTLSNYTVSNVYGPIYIDLGTVEATNLISVQGGGYFMSGGVPSTPSFNVNVNY